MIMAFHAIMANKMRSFLTMLGIIIGIGSVISIVSIGDTMRGLFADLYKDAGATQAVVSIGYNVEDVRDSDYFTLDELDKIKEIFGDEISYIDSYASVNSEVLAGRTNMKFDFQGIDWNFSDVQPVTMISGRYLNEGDILGRKKNVVIEEESARFNVGKEPEKPAPMVSPDFTPASVSICTSSAPMSGFAVVRFASSEPRLVVIGVYSSPIIPVLCVS